MVVVEELEVVIDGDVLVVDVEVVPDVPVDEVELDVEVPEVELDVVEVVVVVVDEVVEVLVDVVEDEAVLTELVVVVVAVPVVIGTAAHVNNNNSVHRFELGIVPKVLFVGVVHCKVRDAILVQGNRNENLI